MLVCFFFQAEDGIRYLVRSRGLGDVYKRQGFDRSHQRGELIQHLAGVREGVVTTRPVCRKQFDRHAPSPLSSASSTAVSYTHLTLPTSDLV